MWKTIRRKTPKGEKLYYRLHCDGCEKPIRKNGEPLLYTKPVERTPADWYIGGDDVMDEWEKMVLCPKCLSEITEDDSPRKSKINLISWETWVKRHNPTIQAEGHPNGFLEYVWPTLRAYGFEKYNEDGTCGLKNQKPKEVALNQIKRGGMPRQNLSWKEVEFVYFIEKWYNEIETIYVFWRKMPNA